MLKMTRQLYQRFYDVVDSIQFLLFMTMTLIMTLTMTLTSKFYGDAVLVATP